MSAFVEIAVLLVLTAGIGLAATLARQPLIVGFIAVGLLAGPAALNLVQDGALIGLLSELGIVVLLFLVGIKLDVKLIRALGPVAVTTGLGQVALTALCAWLIGLALGLGPVTSLFLGIALAFSSTIVIVKLLSDKREIDALHGQIVVLAMIVLSALGLAAEDTGHGGGGAGPAVMIGAGMALVAAVILFARTLAGPLTAWLARTPELLVIFALALTAMLAALGDALGLGKEVGGLLAGIALASTPFRESIAARLAPLRDFLLLFFFITLGATLDLSILGAQLGAAVVLSIFVLVGKPILVIVIMRLLGYRTRTAFLTGISLAQISEFSLIFVALGVSVGQIDPAMLGLVTLVGLVTIALSSMMITLSHPFHALCAPLLARLERPAAAPDDEGPGAAVYPVVIFGLGRFGTAIGLRLARRGTVVLGVDFNPQAVRRWQDLGLAAVFGDATDPLFLAELPLGRADWLVATMPILPTGLSHEDARHTLIQLARGAGFAGRIAAASHGQDETRALSAAGADLVLEPFQDAADRAVELLQGAPPAGRTTIPAIAAEDQAPG
jgi:Kef-type K+ transport system membrane component KefB